MENKDISSAGIPSLTEWVEKMIPAQEVLGAPPISPSHLSALLKDSEERSLDETMELVASDDYTSDRILHWANSASSGAAERITDLKTAILRVGVGSMVQITLLSKFKAFLSIPLKSYGMEESDFWMHAFATAIAAESMENELSFPVPTDCFVAGLVHDIGKVFVDKYVETFSLSHTFGKMDDTDELSHDQKEMEALGLEHASIGSALVQYWGFTPLVVDLVALHHDSKNYQSAEMKVLQMANQIAKTIGRFGGPKLADTKVSQLLADLDLTEEDYEKIRIRCRSKLTRLASTLK